MATYTPISAAEMDEFLGSQGWQRLTLPGTVELVYAKRVDVDGLELCARVYSGINPNGQSRDVGADAIRCQVMWRRPDGELRKVASAARVHRVAGWRANLQKRLDGLVIEGRCPDCGSPMVTRKGPRGKFQGCAAYPECKHTAQVTA